MSACTCTATFVIVMRTLFAAGAASFLLGGLTWAEKEFAVGGKVLMANGVALAAMAAVAGLLGTAGTQ